ncbi:MAG: VOC family protein [Nocardioides sp.]|uniref:VOC family protein n=1 Tax=Nocardioides sp. TaxID=35761 RepID=UPI003F0B4B48
MNGPRVIAVNHVGVSVADLDRARTFWMDGLGALDHGGWSWPAGTAPDAVRCPDGTPITLVEATLPGRTGLVGVTVRVEEPSAFNLARVPGPVQVDVVAGADGSRPRPVDLGVNHLYLDVAGIAGVREGTHGVRWHHPVTESSGGVAAVCYGTTHDGVLVELLESRSDEAFLARTRLTAAQA